MAKKSRQFLAVLGLSELLLYRDGGDTFASVSSRARSTASSSTASSAATSTTAVGSWNSSTALPSHTTLDGADEVISLYGSVAIVDDGNHPYQSAFRLILEDRREVSFSTEDAADAIEWVHALNYACAFDTSGLRIKPLLDTPSALSPPPVSSPHTQSPNSPSPIVASSSPSSSSSEIEKEPERHDTVIRARRTFMVAKIEEIRDERKRVEHMLESELRFARHLQLLAPLQRSTRDRLQEVVFQLAQRIKRQRIELCKWECYESILQDDAEDGDGEGDKGGVREEGVLQVSSLTTSGEKGGQIMAATGGSTSTLTVADSGSGSDDETSHVALSSKSSYHSASGDAEP